MVGIFSIRAFKRPIAQISLSAVFCSTFKDTFRAAAFKCEDRK
ncbi:hypothetical protein TRICHSKD4_4428 [Roseibium sp. TrichSKD4]|nr:hypothetical protein TRICHSKD4_4428 [Roseibium sp. TrichSKD4]